MGTEQKHGKGVVDEDGGHCDEWRASAIQEIASEASERFPEGRSQE